MWAWEYNNADFKIICEQIRLRRLRIPNSVPQSSYHIAVRILDKIQRGDPLTARDKSWAVQRWNSLFPGVNPPQRSPEAPQDDR